MSRSTVNNVNGPHDGHRLQLAIKTRTQPGLGLGLGLGVCGWGFSVLGLIPDTNKYPRVATGFLTIQPKALSISTLSIHRLH